MENNQQIEMGSHYVHIEPNSHFFTNLQQIISYVEMLKKSGETQGFNGNLNLSFDDLLVGLKNTLEKENYELKKPTVTELENQLSLLESLPYNSSYYSGSLDNLKQITAINIKHVNKKMSDIRNKIILSSK